MRLSEVQTRFKDLMLDHPDALHELDPDFAAQFAEGDIPLARRLSVYRNNIVGTFTDILLASFPLLEKLVGKEFLEKTARSFALAHPPEEGCLTFYGRGFAEFLETFPPARSLPYLPDMARLEIAMNESYYARDEKALTPAALAAIPPEDLGNLKPGLRDCVRLLSSPYPLLKIKALCENPEDGGQLSLNAGGICLMTTRRALETEIAPLEADEFDLLLSLQAGSTLGAALEKILEKYPAFDMQAFLQKHLTLETFPALEANR